jgi:hypothetical protein
MNQAAYTYAERMPDDVFDTPKRKAMFLGPDALRDLAITSARRRTERAAVEEALALLARRDAQLDAMANFVEWAHTEWGNPTDEEHSIAKKLLESSS